MYEVSILVPIFNVEKYIERCVRSLMEQTYNNIQFVLVDDSSPDKSVQIAQEVVSEYPARKSQVKFIKHQCNRGLSAARNTAVKNATGLFLCHVDSDDYLEKDAIKNLVEYQIAHEADIVTGLAIREQKGTKNLIEIKEFNNSHDALIDSASLSLRHTIWGRLIRTSLYVDNNLSAKEGTNIGEDVQILPCLFYYAKSTAIMYQLVYHYNCENENSYVFDYQDERKQIRRLEQDIDSYIVVRDFFREKDSVVCVEIEKILSRLCQKLMSLSVGTNDRNKFESAKKIHKSLLCGKVLIADWIIIHELSWYNYWFCKLSCLLFLPFSKRLTLLIHKGI